MQAEMYPLKIQASKRFEKELEKLNKKYHKTKEDLKSLVKLFEKGERPGDVLDNVAPYFVRKVRVKNTILRSEQLAKGYRVIYCELNPNHILLLAIYSKADIKDIKDNEVVGRIKDYLSQLDIE